MLKTKMHFDKAIEEYPDYERFYIFPGLAKLEIDDNESAYADFLKAKEMGSAIGHSLFNSKKIVNKSSLAN